MKLVLIVQARMSSTRLPGKVLKPLGTGTVLSEMLRRMSKATRVDEICVAVPDVSESKPIEQEGARCGATIVRGSEADVLGRFVIAARACDADMIMRVTSDCPLADPALCDAVAGIALQDRADYAANNMPPSFPHGLDCEVFTRAALERAHAEASEPYDREHVTPWIRRHAEFTRSNFSGPGKPLSTHRWTLDHAEDYEFFVRLWEALPPPPAVPGWLEIVDCLDRHPSIAQINGMHKVDR